MCVLSQLPETGLSPLIIPLTTALKTERDPVLQCSSASAIARFMQLALARANCPNDKLTTNLCAFVHKIKFHSPFFLCLQSFFLRRPLSRDPMSTPQLAAAGNMDVSGVFTLFVTQFFIYIDCFIN